jgi:hypothetical protein
VDKFADLMDLSESKKHLDRFFRPAKRISLKQDRESSQVATKAEPALDTSARVPSSLSSEGEGSGRPGTRSEASLGQNGLTSQNGEEVSALRSCALLFVRSDSTHEADTDSKRRCCERADVATTPPHVGALPKLAAVPTDIWAKGAGDICVFGQSRIDGVVDGAGHATGKQAVLVEHSKRRNETACMPVAGVGTGLTQQVQHMHFCDLCSGPMPCPCMVQLDEEDVCGVFDL